MATDTQNANKLLEFLASSYALYLKTQNFHWNVRGEHFYSYHLLFEKQYEELSEAIDVIAERLRALGIFIPANFDDFMRLNKLTKATEHNARDMIQALLADHTTIINLCNEMIKTTGDHGDMGTQDLFIERLRAHDQMVWMLSSLLQ